jgi:methylaspartate ammonia-lyase
VEGLTTVDARYGVVAQAIADETADTMKYIKEKQDAEAAKLVRKLVA